MFTVHKIQQVTAKQKQKTNGIIAIPTVKKVLGMPNADLLPVAKWDRKP